MGLSAWPWAEAVLTDLYQHYDEPSSWHVAHGALEAFTAMRRAGIKVAIVSNWDTRLPVLLRKLGFREGDGEALDAVIVSAEECSEKPDRRIFDIALERLGLTASGGGGGAGVVHVGDSTVNDVVGRCKLTP